MTFAEPMTMLTDYLLGVLALYFAGSLLRAARATPRISVCLWSLAFALIGSAAISGGTAHGFARILPGLAIRLAWIVTLVSIGGAGFFLLAGAIVATVPHRYRRPALTGSALAIAAYAVWMAAQKEFRYVIYGYLAALAVVLFLQIYAAARLRTPAAGSAAPRPQVPASPTPAKWIIAGLLVSFAAAAVQTSNLALFGIFNHNDLYHLVQMAGLSILYIGGLRLTDRPPAK